MIYIDASFYLAFLLPGDIHHKKALAMVTQYNDEENITTQAVLGEVLTVGSQRFDRRASSEFVKKLVVHGTKIVFEDKMLVDRAMEIFNTINDKNVSYVDSYSFAVIEKYQIEKVFSFDSHFGKYLPKVIKTTIKVEG